METKQKITKTQWMKFVEKNCTISYGLVVCLSILCLWEYSCRTKEEANAQLLKFQFHLSGAQAEMAINFALKYEIPEWLDEMMVKICTPK